MVGIRHGGACASAPTIRSLATGSCRSTARWAATPELSLQFSESHQWIGFAMKHLDLLESRTAYAKLREWLAVERARA